MTMEQILGELRSLPGVLELAPQAGSEHPDISWGDYFFYYAPDGRVPQNRQPYATIITKDYPDDTQSHLDPPDRWRLNIHVGQAAFTELIGVGPDAVREGVAGARDFAATDEFLPHPVYGALGWIAVVNPGEGTMPTVTALLRQAHDDDQRRVTRRG